MPVLDPRERFAELVRREDAEIDLARAALLIAAEEYPSLDLEAYLARLDAIADAARPRLAAARDEAARVEQLNQFLFHELGMAGNRDHYYDPRNSYLNDVIDRRCGIPITLSIVYLQVAQRVGLEACGVNFPGHFLVRAGVEEAFVVDAFHGGTLDSEECEERLREVTGAQIALRPDQHLRPATSREILVRLLSNLKHIFLQLEDYGRALASSERILLLTPDAPLELRDRGLVLQRLECHGAALADLERFLRLAPDDESAPAVRRELAALRSQLPALH